MKISRYALYAAVLTASFCLPVAAGSITTTFAGGNRFDGNMFDLSVAATSIDVTSMDVDVDPGSMTIDIYVKTGNWEGSQTTPAAWTLVSQTAVTGQGGGKATSVAVTPFVLNANTNYGIYVTIDTNSNAAPYMYFTNGDNTYSNSNVTITTGDALGGLFGSLYDNGGDRTWDGTINYLLVSGTPEPAPLAILTAAVPGFYLLRRRYLRK